MRMLVVRQLLDLDGALGPSSSVQHGIVYSVPEGVMVDSPVDSRVRKRALKLCLSPELDHMHLNIARALVSSKPRSPKSQSKSEFLSRGLKRL